MEAKPGCVSGGQRPWHVPSAATAAACAESLRSHPCTDMFLK